MFARQCAIRLTTAMPFLALAANVAPASPTVLLLGDYGSETQVQAALTDAGHNVTFAGAHDEWNGVDPYIGEFDVVVFLDGYSYGNDLQPAAQTAIDAFVRTGGGLVITEWATYDAYSSAWNPLITALMPASSPDRDYDYGASWQLIDPTHQLAAWLPAHWVDQAGFSYVVPHESATVVIESHNGDPLVTFRNDLGGTVVHVNHDLTYTTSMINRHALQVIVNAVEFASGTAPEDCNGNGTPDFVDFANGVDTDRNLNRTLDGCEPDCNGNDVPDDLDIGPGSSFAQVPFEFDPATPAEWDFVNSCDGCNTGEVLLPFGVSLGDETLTRFMMTSDGYVELYRTGEMPNPPTYGTVADLVMRGDPKHTYLLAGFDDLDSGTIGGFGYRIGVGHVTFYWETQTYQDDDGTYMGVNIYQIVLSADGNVQWNFASEAVLSYDYDLLSGIFLGYAFNALHTLMSGGLPETQSLTFTGPQPPVDTDQNFNGVPDACDTDCNHNGVPDDLDLIAPAGPGFRRVGQEYVIAPSFDWVAACDTCQSDVIGLPFPVTLSSQTYTSFVMTSDGFVELLRTGDTPYGWFYGHVDDLVSRTGGVPGNPTHTYLLAAYDDLSSSYNGMCGYSVEPTKVRFYWNTETYEDSESERLNEFSLTLYDDSTVRWDFYDAAALQSGYDLFTGIYLGHADRVLYELTRNRIPDHESWLFRLDGFSGGGSSDANGNAVPDECEVAPGDMNGDGLVSADDVVHFLACLDGPGVPHGPGCAAADVDIDGAVDLADAAAFCCYFTAP